MNRQQFTFFVTGLVAGLICVSLVFLGPPEIAITSLTSGVGPIFFIGVVGGILISGAWRQFRPGLLRYFAGLVLCTISYLTAAVVFWWVFGLSPGWIGFAPSDNIGNFGFDVWLGLIAAGLVGASGITLFAALLTGRWSNSLFRRLMLAGLLTICITFIVNLPFQKDGSFLGVLLPLGNALFSYLVGAHIWHLKAEGQIAATAPQPHHRPA
jgi:hypothetical protein